MINLLDIALLAAGGALLMLSAIMCSQLERPLTNAVKWWCLWLLFLAAIALSGCATTLMTAKRKGNQFQHIIQGHISELAHTAQLVQKSEIRLSQNSDTSTKQTDPVILTREQWLFVRSAQLRRQAKIRLQRIELEACKKQSQVHVQRERKKREQAHEQHKAAIASAERQVILPWVIVGVTATAALVGFSLYIGKIGKIAP